MASLVGSLSRSLWERLRPPAWRWIEGIVGREMDHIVLTYRDGPNPVALLSPGPSQTFIVEFPVEPTGEDARLKRDAARRELDFYLVELRKPDPWAYAIYHCGTAANAYSDVHWSFFPRGHRPCFQRADGADRGGETVQKEWLQNVITVAEAEAMNTPRADTTERHKRFPELSKPFGFQNAEWQSLKAQMRDGDELWTFCSPATMWRNMAGREGVALVRNGNVVGFLVTRMN